MVDTAGLDIGSVFGGFNFGLGTLGNVFLVLFIAVFIIGLIGVAIFVFVNNKKYKHTIPLYRKVGSMPIRVAVYKAKDYKIGNAGDKLWFVRKAKKFIPPATIQTAPNEYPHFEREDGEWINFGLGDIDKQLKEAGVKYVHQDMRANRIAISNLLEQRFTKKSFWDKYGNIIMNVIFYLVVAIAMVIIFYQWSNIVDKTGTLIDKIIALEDQRKASGGQGVVPAIALLIGGFGKWALAKH